MDKPKPESREPILDYHECADYVSYLLGYDIRDTLGKFGANNVEHDVEYRDWWHFLVDRYDHIKNGCVTGITSELLEDCEEWQREITQKFIDEFGDGEEYEVWW